MGDRVLRHTAMVLTHNMELSLTQSLKRSEQADGMCTPTQSPRRSAKEEEEEDFADVSESMLCSPSYRLLRFLRQLVEALKSLGGLS